MVKVEIKNLYKIFGKNPQKALEALTDKGLSKEELQKKNNHILGLRDINLQIEQGKFFVIIGLSGSGKSTLIRNINQLSESTSGEVLIDGLDITKYKKKELRELRKEKLSMVFQKFGLFPNKTIYENIIYAKEIKKETIDEEKVKEIFELVGLEGYEEYYPAQLSGGMQQRVGIARALFSETEIILMDEAFSALDPIARRQLQDEIIDIQEATKKTIIFITHDIEEALKLGDTIAIMKDGEVIQVGTAEEIVTNPINDYVEEFVSSSNKLNFIRLGQIADDIFQTFDIEEKYEDIQSKLTDNYYYILTKNGRYYGLFDRRKLEPSKSLIDQAITKGVHLFPRGTNVSDVLVEAFKTKFPFVLLNPQKKPIAIVRQKAILELLEEETNS